MREGLTGQGYHISAPLERTGVLMRQARDMQQECVGLYVCLCVYVCVGGRRQAMLAVTWSLVCWCSVQLY